MTCAFWGALELGWRPPGLNERREGARGRGLQGNPRDQDLPGPYLRDRPRRRRGEGPRRCARQAAGGGEDGRGADAGSYKMHADIIGRNPLVLCELVAGSGTGPGRRGDILRKVFQ